MEELGSLPFTITTCSSKINGCVVFIVTGKEERGNDINGNDIMKAYFFTFERNGKAKGSKWDQRAHNGHAFATL
jgi:hypothetical protein